ncbi:putative DNA-binding domain-containing protein [Pseudomonas sp. NA13]
MTREELAALQVSFTQALDCSSSPSVLPQGWLETASAGDRRRFARYRSGLWRHQEQSLALTYPVIKALVGDHFFARSPMTMGGAIHRDIQTWACSASACRLSSINIFP